MPNRIEVSTGELFGRLKIVREMEEYVSIGGHRTRQFLCRCSCGKNTTVILNSLRMKKTISCGCFRKETAGRTIEHGYRTPGRYMEIKKTYESWRAMRRRCFNRKDKIKYNLYGGRGIKIGKEWDNFQNFLDDMGKRPDGKTLDRIDNNGNYSKENCKWSTPKEQAKNRRPRREGERT